MKELEYPFDAQYILKKRRAIKRELLKKNELIKKRIAVLGGSTTDDIVSAAELFLLDNGIEPVFWQSEYNKFYEDGVFGNDELDSFKPDIVWVCTSAANLRLRSDPALSADEAQARIDGELSRFEQLWQSLKRFGCPVIQNNFDQPFYALMGSMDCWDIRGLGYAVNYLNMEFAKRAQSGDIILLDLSRTAAEFGLDRWHDRSGWYMYKYMCAREAVPYVGHRFSLIVKSLYGRNKKLLALDLDNTLWGGIVGEDGADALEIGQETGTGQSYYEFQQYVKDLTKLGVVLTVCSKNDEENALAGLEHPEGVLKPSDFALIKANWEPKDKNLLQTVEQLDLLPSAIAFADDNPAERAIVRRSIADAALPELDGECPEDYIRQVSRGGWFEPTAISQDDLSRNEMYRKNAKRAELAAAAGDYGEYLASLEMKAEIRGFREVYLARIAQLTNKSNQFNLTTRRFTAEEMEGFMRSDRHITLYGRLTDSCGDNGVVSVVVGEIADDDTLEITLWLMSCRVLKRGMELAMLDTLVHRARERGLSRLVGRYIPTAKNKMVSRLYPDEFGFAEIGEGLYELTLSGYEDKNKYIEVSED